MDYTIKAGDVVMSGEVLADFAYGSAATFDVTKDNLRERAMDRKALLERLRGSDRLAQQLLATRGHIIYMGPYARESVEQGTLGMRFAGGDDGAVRGDNVYGRFLEDVREELRRELGRSAIRERKGSSRIVVDWPEDDGVHMHSDIMEERGERPIHTERYRPARFVRDTALDGTTGHAQHGGAGDVAFQTFECPFGTGEGARVRVGSAAEVSYCYERALRGDLDYALLLKDLRARGLVKNMPRREEEELVGDLRAQFDWMRERILTDGSLAGRPIVAESLLVPDASMGRSVYDATLAPAPAHILARYIANPLLLSAASENGVLRALAAPDKGEQLRFSVSAAAGTVAVIVDGSDTIGGRVPGTRATRERHTVFVRDAAGNTVYSRNGSPVVKSDGYRYKLQFKGEEEIEADYKAFASRLDSIVSNIGPDVKIRLVTGDGAGTPRMVRRYVEERGGRVMEWDYAAGKAVASRKGPSGDTRFSQVMMHRMERALPVFLGTSSSVSYPLGDDAGSAEGVVTKAQCRDIFGGASAAGRGYVTFSVAADARNAELLHRGSLAAAAGMHVIHVQDNRVEQDQALWLEAECSMARNALTGEETYGDTLFGGELRTAWDMDGGRVCSYVSADDGVAVPHVAFRREAAVYVSSMAYHTVYGAYAALVMKSAGVASAAAYRRLAGDETSMEAVAKTLSKYEGAVDAAERERCMRRAVHLMAQASPAFAAELLATGTSDLLCVSTWGGAELFCGLDGKGENRFGVVLAAERDRLRREVDAATRKAEAEARQVAEDNARLQRRATARRAQGEKVAAGLPQDVAAAAGAVWFLGAARPAQLMLPDDERSFYLWTQSAGGADMLCRELASRATLADGEGGVTDNNLVFLFPSDLLAVMGRRQVQNRATSKDLTGVKRLNPATGHEFVCAYGVPVKYDNRYYEADNALGRKCSWRLDGESAAFADGIVAADALARTTALDEGMALSYAVYERPGGEENDDLSRPFNARIYDFPRTREEIDRNTGRTITEGGMIMPVEVSRRVYDKEQQEYVETTEKKYRRTMVDNPHAAPKLKGQLRRWQQMLKEGDTFPLNCICLPLSDYEGVSEERFLADFGFALSVANATAMARGVPMRFPLDKEGRLDLGPGVSDRLRDMAERRLDAFIGTVRREDVLGDTLPLLRRVRISETVRRDAAGRNVMLKGDGSDLWIRPLDLVAAFGAYDFRAVGAGTKVPIHEMAFRGEDGTVFRVTDPRLTYNMSSGEINKYLRYEKNDVCRFVVRSSDPEKTPAFVRALQGYIERARQVTVETRLQTEEQASGRDYPLDCFVHLRSSNADLSSVQAGDVAPRGDVTALDAPNRFDGTDGEGVYYGKEDAGDSFAGYVEYRYSLPGGGQSDWKLVEDKELATDIVYSSVYRVYRSDTRFVPSRQVLDAQVRALAVDDAGTAFLKPSGDAAKTAAQEKTAGKTAARRTARTARTTKKDKGNVPQVG